LRWRRWVACTCCRPALHMPVHLHMVHGGMEGAPGCAVGPLLTLVAWRAIATAGWLHMCVNVVSHISAQRWGLGFNALCLWATLGPWRPSCVVTGGGPLSYCRRCWLARVRRRPALCMHMVHGGVGGPPGGGGHSWHPRFIMWVCMVLADACGMQVPIQHRVLLHDTVVLPS
jgi:hypothetical protein